MSAWTSFRDNALPGLAMAALSMTPVGWAGVALIGAGLRVAGNVSGDKRLKTWGTAGLVVGAGGAAMQAAGLGPASGSGSEWVDGIIGGGPAPSVAPVNSSIASSTMGENGSGLRNSFATNSGKYPSLDVNVGGGAVPNTANKVLGMDPSVAIMGGQAISGAMQGYGSQKQADALAEAEANKLADQKAERERQIANLNVQVKNPLSFNKNHTYDPLGSPGIISRQWYAANGQAIDPITQRPMQPFVKQPL